MQGNKACAEAAIAAGCRFYAGYPITPSSEIAEEMAALLPRVGGKFIQMEDEIASMGAVIGASVGGLKAMTATSGPGFSLKQENFGYAIFTEIPCVIVNVMRGGPSTGLPTAPAQADVLQARWGTHGDHPIIVLVPASVKEVYDLTIQAFNLTEEFRTPVILLYDEVIGHMRETVEIPDPATYEIIYRKKPSGSPAEYLPYAQTEDDIPPMASFGDGYRYHITGLVHDERGYPTENKTVAEALQQRLHRKITRHLDRIVRFERFALDDAEIAIFAYGITARSARQAVRMARNKGLKVGLFRPITLWPFPEEAMAQVTTQVDLIVVAEMNLGQMIYEVERVNRGRARIVGCHKVSGEPLSPGEILHRILQVMQCRTDDQPRGDFLYG